MAGGVWWTLRLEDGARVAGSPSASSAPCGCPSGSRGATTSCVVESRRRAGPRSWCSPRPPRAHRAERPPVGASSCRSTRRGGEHGVGDFADARRARRRWGADLGGELVGSTPLLRGVPGRALRAEPVRPREPALLERALPGSRRLAGARSAAARPGRLLASAPHVAELTAPERGARRRHRGAMAAKRPVLEAMLGSLARRAPRRSFARYRARAPRAGDYAGFRARRASSTAGRWRGRARRRAPATPPPVPRLRAVALLDEQLAAAAKGRRDGSGFGSALPGHAARRARRGYDMWRDRDRSPRASRRLAARHVLPGRPGVGLPAAAPARIRALGRDYWSPLPAPAAAPRRARAHRPRDGPAPPLLGPARVRGCRWRVRQVSGGRAVRDGRLEVAARRHDGGRRGSRHRPGRGARDDALHGACSAATCCSSSWARTGDPIDAVPERVARGHEHARHAALRRVLARARTSSGDSHWD